MLQHKAFLLGIVLFCGYPIWNDVCRPQFSSASEDVYSDYVDAVLEEEVERFRRVAGNDKCEEHLNTTEEIKVIKVYPTSVELEWSPIEHAMWYSLAVKAPDVSCIRGASDNILETRLTLRDLDANTEYTVEVAGRHMNGCSDPKAFTFTTRFGSWKCEGGSGGLYAVENLHVVAQNITSTTALVLWDPVPTALRYQVAIAPPHPLIFGLNDIAEEKTVINGLTPGKKYSLSVYAENDKSKGPPTQKTFITRLEAPGEFAITNATDTFLKVSWKKSKRAKYYITVLNELVAGDSVEVHRFNVTSTYKHFFNLRSSTKYEVELQAFNDVSNSLKLRKILFSKLPTPKNIEISNITQSSVFTKWRRVAGSTGYRVILRNYPQFEIVKDEIINGTDYLLDQLNPASQYELEVIAFNEVTTSLPGTQTVYTRLEYMKHLNVDMAYVQDTSLVVRWDPVVGAQWYEVYVQPNKKAIAGTGVIEKEYTRIENLTPGTMYTITVVAKNSKKFDTVSLPVTVQQFTKLSRPKNLSAEYQQISNTSMKVTWLPVPFAESYLLLVYDCSGQSRNISREIHSNAADNNQRNAEPLKLPDKYQSYARFWDYSYTKEKAQKLQCAKEFGSTEHAIEEGNTKRPSDVLGQGRLFSPKTTLSNMKPGGLYEILVVSGSADIQSYPSLILQHTKLTTPSTLRVDSKKITSGSVYLEWEDIPKATLYKVDVFRTPVLEKASLRKKESIGMIYEKTLNANSATLRVFPLKPTTNYTFKLIACNNVIESFPAYVTTFTLLGSPQTLHLVEENRTADTIVLQWTPVDHALSYSVRTVASNARMKRQEPLFINVSEPQIVLRYLLPNTKYQIAITAQNRHTRSRPVTAKPIFTKLPTPQNFTVSHVNDSSIHVTWSPVEGNKQYRLAAIVCPMEPKEISMRKKIEDNHYTFTHLEPNTAYCIYMKASTAETDSDVVMITQYTQLPKPQVLRFNEISDTTLKISWYPVKDAQVYNLLVISLFNESVTRTVEQLNASQFTDIIQVGNNGNSKQHLGTGKSRTERIRRSGTQLDESGVKRIEYVQFKKLPNSQRYQQTESKESFADIYNVYNINLTSTMVLLKFLEPAVKYKVLVRAISFKTRSDPVFKEDFTKLKQPYQLEAREVKHDRMSLRWAKGITKATYYHVQVFRESKNWDTSITRPVSGNTMSTEVQVLGLKANTQYTIVVTAWNDHVSSSRASISQITKLSPTENLRVAQSSVKYDRFHVLWNKVKEAEKYLISISPPTTHSREQFELPYDENKLTLHNLKDDTKYTVTVRAKNHRTYGVPRSITVWTKLLPPRGFHIVSETVNATSFSVVWEKVISADEYILTLRNSSGTIVNRNITTKKLRWVFIGLAAGNQYSVTLVAKNTKHQTHSDPVQDKTFTKLKSPQNFAVNESSLTDKTMLVKWDVVPLASEYHLTVGIEVREEDDYSVFWHLKKQQFHVSSSYQFIENLQPASYYLVELKAINDYTESQLLQLHQFTKLPYPRNITLEDGYYMDTEANFEWRRVKKAGYYELNIYRYSDANSSVQINENDAEISPKNVASNKEVKIPFMSRI